MAGDADGMVDLFTRDEVERARALRAECGPGEFAARCAREIVAAAMPRIDRATGQANDTKYMAYRMEFVLNALAEAEARSGAGPRR